MSQNQKYLLCKKINLQNCNKECSRAHNINELEIINCHYETKCKILNCPFLHPCDNISKQEYYERIYNYISPYQTEYTSICRYIDIGCKIEKCRKAHSIEELNISNCDCFRTNCPFFHDIRDKNITKEQYFMRMKSWIKTLKKTNKDLLCRYINIGCRRINCPYAHNIDELNIHKCIFSNCKSTCIFLHSDETISKKEYFNRMLKYISPIKPYTVICNKNNCNYDNCMYAHTFEQFIVTSCIRGNECKKHCCPFKHPDENLDKNIYYKRMLYASYPN